MLDDFMLEQPVAYKILKNSIINNKVSHAYIIEANGYSKSFDLARSFAKYLLCPNCYTNKEKCLNCNQCTSIDNNDYIELKIIEADGQWIKKSQLDELQIDFSKKSVLGNKKIYIIKDADKLNASSANSLLKFLEEPEEGIIAILLVDNIYQMIGTIVSRCQVISLKPNKTLEGKSTIEKIADILFNSESEINEFINNEDDITYINKVIEFSKYYEDHKLNTLIYINKLWNDYFKDRNLTILGFSIMLLLYKDILNQKLGKDIEVFNEYTEDVKYICEKNDIECIIDKINVIMKLRDLIKFNINQNALMDKLIIELKGCESR